jgi:glc operon protein GlcG
MRRLLMASLFACGSLVCGAGASGQTPPPAVPEQMPFDIPYGAPITMEHARQVADAAYAEAKRHNWKLAISVVDPSGNLVYFAKMDGTQFASIAISQHKARVAASFRRPTQVFEDQLEGGHPYAATLDGMIGSRGGFPLVEGGKMIGAIGCSGGAGVQDAQACKSGAEQVK